MAIVVIIFNISLALVLLYGAWRVRGLQRRLARLADIISRFEPGTHRVLHRAPNAISKGQLGVNQLRQKQQQLEPQIQRVQLVLTLLSLGQQVWRRFILTR